MSKAATGLGATTLAVTKSKFLLIFIATQAKLLLLGLTKMTTLLSMLLSAGVYWTAWGWKFALGVVISIYVHEMGHVQALQRFGIKATCACTSTRRPAAKTPVSDSRDRCGAWPRPPRPTPSTS